MLNAHASTTCLIIIVMCHLKTFFFILLLSLKAMISTDCKL